MAHTGSTSVKNKTPCPQLVMATIALRRVRLAALLLAHFASRWLTFADGACHRFPGCFCFLHIPRSGDCCSAEGPRCRRNPQGPAGGPGWRLVRDRQVLGPSYASQAALRMFVAIPQATILQPNQPACPSLQSAMTRSTMPLQRPCARCWARRAARQLRTRTAPSTAAKLPACP